MRLTETMYWRGYLAGAQDAVSRYGSSLGPDADWGNTDFDRGYRAGWQAETSRPAEVDTS